MRPDCIMLAVVTIRNVAAWDKDTTLVLNEASCHEPGNTSTFSAFLPAAEQGWEVQAVSIDTLIDEARSLTPSGRVRLLKIDAELASTPFGVPITMRTWAGAAQVAAFGSNMYILHKAFPDVFGPRTLPCWATAPPPDGADAERAPAFDALLDGRRLREDLGFRPRFPRLADAIAAAQM